MGWWVRVVGKDPEMATRRRGLSRRRRRRVVATRDRAPKTESMLLAATRDRERPRQRVCGGNEREREKVDACNEEISVTRSQWQSTTTREVEMDRW
jgi:hypothetical protein